VRERLSAEHDELEARDGLVGRVDVVLRDHRLALGHLHLGRKEGEADRALLHTQLASRVLPEHEIGWTRGGESTQKEGPGVVSTQKEGPGVVSTQKEGPGVVST
jgi:hypothetical protein